MQFPIWIKSMKYILKVIYQIMSQAMDNERKWKMYCMAKHRGHKDLKRTKPKIIYGDKLWMSFTLKPESSNNNDTIWMTKIQKTLLCALHGVVSIWTVLAEKKEVSCHVSFFLSLIGLKLSGRNGKRLIVLFCSHLPYYRGCPAWRRSWWRLEADDCPPSMPATISPFVSLRVVVN